MNDVKIIGNMTRDPESKEVGGSTLVTFSIAVNEWTPGKDGREGRESVSYFDVEAWGKAGDAAFNLDRKFAVLVDGALKQQSWPNKEGKKQSKVIIKAFKVASVVRSRPSGNNQQPGNTPTEDGDIPF